MLHNYFKVYSFALFTALSLYFLGICIWIMFNCFPHHGCDMIGLFIYPASVGFILFFTCIMLLRRLDKRPNIKIVLLFLVLTLSFFLLKILLYFLDNTTVYTFSYSYLFFSLSLLLVSLDSVYPNWKLFSGPNRGLANFFGLTILIINTIGLSIFVQKYFADSLFFINFLLALYFLSQLFLGIKFFLENGSVIVK